MQVLLATSRRIPTGWICRSCSRGLATEAKKYDVRKGLNKDYPPFRTRFAPSPTGYLHLGSLRTALFNFLVAKATGGQFILRIEDTDQKRTVPDAEKRLLEDLRWAGIDWDEGPEIGGPYGPYKQSERLALYREHVGSLLENGTAYRCFCSGERLHDLATYRSKLGFPAAYDRTCAHLNKGESNDRAAEGEAHVVRLRAPPKYGAFQDIVYGTVKQKSDLTTRLDPSSGEFFDDPILMKTDGFPTYHLANVVDDHYMNISHVIRGSEWISSTPKHLALYKAFNWEPPEFAHVGLLLNKDNQKLSKRDGAIEISIWRDKGIFPEALVNYVALLGWSHNTKQDIMNMESLIKNASMKYTRGDAVASSEKLWFLQRKYAARYAADYNTIAHPLNNYNPRTSLTDIAIKPIVSLLNARADKEFLFLWKEIPTLEKEAYVRSIFVADAQNYATPSEFIARNIYFFVTPSQAKLEAKIPREARLHGVPSMINYEVGDISALFQNIADIPEESWNYTKIKEMISYITSRGVEASMQDDAPTIIRHPLRTRELVQKAWSKIIHKYLRWAIAGGNDGPASAETMAILGRDQTLKRMGVANLIMLEDLERFALEKEEEKRVERERREKEELAEKNLSEKERKELKERRELAELARQRRDALARRGGDGEIF